MLHCAYIVKYTSRPYLPKNPEELCITFFHIYSWYPLIAVRSPSPFPSRPFSGCLAGLSELPPPGVRQSLGQLRSTSETPLATTLAWSRH